MKTLKQFLNISLLYFLVFGTYILSSTQNISIANSIQLLAQGK